jgi:hypothetical protein
MMIDPDLQETIKRWAKNPRFFVVEALGVKPEKWQTDALKALRDHNRVAIRSGHGVGKSALLAWCILWWLLTRYPAKVACTANTSTQLSDVLWGELDKWYRNLPKGFQKLLDMKSDRMELLGDPKQSFAVARTARKETPEAFQGYHSPNMLFIIDEASGVDDIIFEVGRGAMSSKGAKTIMTGNPTRTNGYFYNAFHSMAAFWHTMKVGCEDSSMVSPQYLEECKEEYGEDSNAYRVRVLGEFPVEGDDVVIPLHLVESAINRGVEQVGEEIWGLDVARFGDDRTALAKRKGNTLAEPVKWIKNKDTMQVSGWVIDQYNEAQKKPDVIYVDSIGYGAAVVDRLGEQGIPVQGINVAELPAFSDRFIRMREELWWTARDWFMSRECSIPDDGALLSELTIPVYNFTSGGKIKMESKEEIKKRTARTATGSGKSPDLADAFCLTFANGVLVMRKPKRLEYPRMAIV